MYHSLKTNFVVLAFVSVCLFGATASAECADSNKLGALLHRQSWRGANSFQPGSLLAIAEDNDPFVGMWHVTFIAQGNELGPPDGTPIDNSFVTWHSDGTELMNSGRPPPKMGISAWVFGKRLGSPPYKLNHFAWGGNDTANAPGGIGNPQGPARFFEEITLSADGKHYTGHFTLDAYDTNGTQVAHLIGVIAGTRITLDTTVGDLL